MYKQFPNTTATPCTKIIGHTHYNSAHIQVFLLKAGAGAQMRTTDTDDGTVVAAVAAVVVHKATNPGQGAAHHIAATDTISAAAAAATQKTECRCKMKAICTGVDSDTAAAGKMTDSGETKSCSFFAVVVRKAAAADLSAWGSPKNEMRCLAY